MYYLRGSPRSFRDLQRCNILQASAAILLSGFATNAYHTRRGAVAVDGPTVFRYRVMRRANPSLQITTELSQGANVTFLSETISNTSSAGLHGDFRLSELFAAGAMYSPSMLDALICQSFFSPNLVHILRLLLSEIGRAHV